MAEENKISLAEDLADRILRKRKMDIYNSFFGDVTKETYDKYFKSQGKAKKPYLQEGIYGHKWTDGEGHVHHEMLQKGRWQYKKVGKKRKPVKSQMKEEINTGRKLIKMNKKVSLNEKQAMTFGGNDGFLLKLAFDGKVPTEYKSGSYEYDHESRESFNANDIEKKYGQERFEKKGKMSKFDKEVAETIKEWASDNLLTIHVESVYNED